MRPSRKSLNALVWFAGLTTAALALGQASSVEPTKTLRFSITLSNPSGERIDDAHLKVFGPLAAPASNQRVVALASEPYREEIDVLGNRAILFSGLTLAPYAKRRFIMTFALDQSPRPYTPLPVSESFLAPEPLIESNAPEIARQAARLLALAEKSQFPRRALEWVADHIRYEGFVAADRGALFGLREAKGDCTEYASLFVALMRASGVPARVVGGWTLKGSGLARAADYHNWAEYYADGRWRLADPQRRVFDTDGDDYVATRIVARKSGDAAFPYRYETSPSTLQVTWD